jgi:hypothetical protein
MDHIHALKLLLSYGDFAEQPTEALGQVDLASELRSLIASVDQPSLAPYTLYSALCLACAFNVQCCFLTAF